MKIQAIRKGIGGRLRQLAVVGSALVLSVSVTAQDYSSLFGQTAPPMPSGGTAASGLVVNNGQLVSNGQAFKVVDASQVATAGSKVGSAAAGSSFASRLGGDVAQVNYGSAGGCQSCGTGTCNGNCGGGYGATYGGFAGGNACGELCNPYRYVNSEVLYMNRLGDDNFTLSENFGFNDFDWELTPRVTFGIVPDCVHGWEAGFTGPLEWNRRVITPFNAGAYNAFRFPGAFYDNDLNPVTPEVPVPEFDAFYDADRQWQQQNVEYFSVEASRTLIGWQIAKLLYGVRYINYEEDYLFFSQKGVNTAQFNNDAQNHMIGGQVGMDLFYPVCRNGVADFRGRAGAYINFAEASSRVFNNANLIPARRYSDKDEELAGVFEFGSGLRYNLGEALSVRVGSEMWYLTGLATSQGESRSVVVDRNQQVRADDDVLMIGLTVSAELKY